jgi:hypothetical protein
MCDLDNEPVTDIELSMTIFNNGFQTYLIMVIEPLAKRGY